MPLTQLDPVTALIVIDMQKGIVSLPGVELGDIVSHIADLAAAFRKAGQPVVLVNVNERAPGRTERSWSFNPPADWADLIPELNQQPGDHLVTKRQVGAFYRTELDAILRKVGATQVVMTGVATGSGVEATARQAYDHGFNVAFVTDAMTDLDPTVHAHSIEKTFPRIGERATTAEVTAMLKP